ncbi:MAG: metallophosphoesterase [Candidatus Nanohaloarchaeota archaeon]|nr:metallophosphoesterase [Candidatus Nanohaloarchaeota archaeon]
MNNLSLMNGLEISSKGAVYFKDDSSYLVVGDLHLGLEKYMRQQGVFVSKKQLKEIKLILNDLINKYGKDITLILNGDIKHDFGKYTYEDKKEIKNLLTYLSERIKHLVLIKGNHDNYLISIAEELGIELKESFETEKFFVFHGDKDLKFPERKHVVMHHLHPSLTLKDEVGAKLKIPCFLVSKRHQYYRIIAPALSHYSPGMNVLHWTSSKILDIRLEDYEVYAVDGEEIYFFGKLGKLREKI